MASADEARDSPTVKEPPMTAESAKEESGEKPKESSDANTVETSDKNGEAGEGGKQMDETPSKRVQEARAYNNRDRRYNNDRNKKDFKKNIKSDFSSQKETDDPVQIRKQVEFYFSDSNLLTDAFLFKLVDGPANNPVPLTTIHSFKRMRHFQPFSAVISALKDSSTLDIIEQDPPPSSTEQDAASSSKDPDSTITSTTTTTTNPSIQSYTPADLKVHIQRKTPLPASTANKSLPEIARVHEDATMSRSIYAKGFGAEEPSTQFDIEAFFAQYGTTRSVRQRRTVQKLFKGSVFVEFDSEETAKGFLEKHKCGDVKWKGDQELKVMSKKRYCDEKVEEIRKGNIRRNSPHRGPDGGGEDTRDWRTRRDEDRKNGSRSGRGGRGGGGGGRGKGRGGRGGRGRDRDRDRTSPPKISTTTTTTTTTTEVDDKQPETAAATASQQDAAPASAEAPTIVGISAEVAPAPESKKRARDEEDSEANVENANKKVDTKQLAA